MAKWPAIAVAAATAGDTRCVRPPLPWRPSKLRFDVDAHRSPGRELVGVHRQAHRAPGLPPVEPGGDEHLVEPLGLGLAPSPSSSPARPACARRRAHVRPGGDRGGGAQVLDARVRARADEHGVDRDLAHRRARLQAHVARAPARRCRGRRRRRTSRATGTASSMITVCAGLVPHVTDGRSAAASSTTSLSNVAPSSVTSARQSSSARSHAAPVGANSRPSR